MISVSVNHHSSIFKTSIGKGDLKTHLTTDQGADANFISSRQFRKIQNKGPRFYQKALQPTQIYGSVTGGPCIKCKMSVDMDVVL